MSDDFHDGLPVIRSPKNDRLRLAKSLSSKRGRRHKQRYLLEGPKVIAEVIVRDAARLEQILYRVGKPLGRAAKAVLEAARSAQVPCYPVAVDPFDAAAPAETPQPLLGIARLRWTPLEAMLGGEVGDEVTADAPRAAAACLGVQDPGNLGTILRSARFLGFAGAVVLPGTQDPFSPKVVRSSAGALCADPPAKADDLTALLAAASAASMQSVALVPRGGTPLHLAELPRRALLLLGAEGPGLENAAADAATLKLTIPTPEPDAESLNVAVAFAVVAHAWCARWRLS